MSLAPTAPIPTQRPRRRGRGLAVTLVVLLLAAGGAVAADRIAANVAADRIATAIANETAGQDVAIDVGAFPFLTQLARRELNAVDLTAATLTLDGLTIQDVTAHATAIDLQAEAAGTVTATGMLPTATLQSLVDRAVGAAIGGEEDVNAIAIDVSPQAVTASLDLLGLVTLAVDLEPVAQGRSIGLGVASVSVGGLEVTPSELPFGLGDIIAERLDALAIDLDGELPPGLLLEDIELADGGARVTISGTDITLESFA